MKKLLVFLLITSLLLCSCGNNEQGQNTNKDFEINYDKVSRRNNRTVLMEKYNYVKESISYYDVDKDMDAPDRTIEYHNDPDTGINVKYTFGNTKQYFYNNIIYTTEKKDNYCVIPYKSDYNTEVLKMLKRENTLNYVYYTQKECHPDENGYFVSYWFTLTRDVLPEFAYWDVSVGDTIKVDYNLNKDFEIMDYTYYIVNYPHSEQPVFKKIMTSVTEFDVPYNYPDFVYEADLSAKYTLTIYESYNMPSQYIEKHIVPENMRIKSSDNFFDYPLFTDYNYENKWNYKEDKIESDLTLYTILSEDFINSKN